MFHVSLLWCVGDVADLTTTSSDRLQVSSITGYTCVYFPIYAKKYVCYIIGCELY